MKLYNINDNDEQVSFVQALKQGLGRHQGLFFPSDIPEMPDIDALLDKDFVTRSGLLLSALIGDEMRVEDVHKMADRAFVFPAPLVKVTDDISALELFHGPTLAFKDFGARFMAQSLAAICDEGKERDKGKMGDEGKITILTATSGDTGAAVAHAFYKMENIQVVILYPKGKISPLQEALFCTLGENIHTLAINGTFDDCQSLVKQAFDDEELKKEIGLNSANSINISRIIAQICYYFEAMSALSKTQRENVVVAVPCGNFGNLTAGLLAKAMGAPIKRFIVATNANDTVPRYLKTGIWSPKETVTTLSNAMDVSQPNNWPRIEEICKVKGWGLDELTAVAFNDEQTAQSIQSMFDEGYLCEPHGAIAYRALKSHLKEGEHGIFLCTAHPAKFKETVDEILQKDIYLPDILGKHALMPLLSIEKEMDYKAVRDFLIEIKH